MYLDVAKAFDTVLHHRILFKLKGCGICGKVLQWIAAFLDGRRQRVIVNGNKSSSGISQGSELGPILFVCYINDMFADDTQIYRHITTQSDQKQQEELSRKWQLCFNEEKCKVVHLGRNNHKYEYVIARRGTNTTLGDTTDERDFGVQVDPELKFDQHVELLTNKANRILGLFRRSSTFLDGPTTKKLYSSLVRPNLEYRNVTGAPILKRDQRI